MKLNSNHFTSSLALAACLVASPSAAQGTGVNENLQGTATGVQPDIDAIVVTARRTSESLEKVPVAVTALSARDLTEQRVVNENDLQTVAAGLTARTTNSSEQIAFALRGQTLDAFSYSAPSVLTYFNETQITGVASSAFYDLQSIQVVKGPQGTLFGRNAVGGAVLYQTQQPDNEFGGYVRVGYGNLDNKEAEGAINLPLGEAGALRIAGRFQQRDGWQYNRQFDESYGSINSKSIRGTLLLQPSPSFKNVTTVQVSSGKGESTSLKLQSFNRLGSTGPNGAALNGTADAIYNTPLNVPNGSGGTMPNPLFTPSAYAELTRLGVTQGIRDYFDNIQPKLGFREVITNIRPVYASNAETVTNTTTFEVSDNATIKNIFGYNNVRSVNLVDDDGSPFEVLNVGSFGIGENEGLKFRNRDLSDELQISGTAMDKRLTYIAGIYYSNQVQRQSIPLSLFTDTIIATPATACPPGYTIRGDISCGYAFKVRDVSKAVFAQVGFKLTDTLTSSAGFRWTREEVELVHREDSPYALLGVPGGKISQSKPSWTIGLDWQATPQLMIYAVNRGSWRTGGFNGTSATNGVSNGFKAETTWDVEFGAKYSGNLGTMPVRANLAIYNQEVSNAIRAVYIELSSVTGNVKKVRIRGFEADATIAPTEWLRLGGQVAYTDARYTDPRAQVGNATLNFGPYADTPKWVGSAYFRLNKELANGSELVLRGDVFGQTHSFYSNLTGSIVPGARLPGYALVNGRAEWNNIAGSQVSLAAYAKNLTNENYYTGGIALGPIIGINTALPAIGRTFGFEMGVRF